MKTVMTPDCDRRLLDFQNGDVDEKQISKHAIKEAAPPSHELAFTLRMLVLDFVTG